MLCHLERIFCFMRDISSPKRQCVALEFDFPQGGVEFHLKIFGFVTRGTLSLWALTQNLECGNPRPA